MLFCFHCVFGIFVLFVKKLKRKEKQETVGKRSTDMKDEKRKAKANEWKTLWLFCVAWLHLFTQPLAHDLTTMFLFCFWVKDIITVTFLLFIYLFTYPSHLTLLFYVVFVPYELPLFPCLFVVVEHLDLISLCASTLLLLLLLLWVSCFMSCVCANSLGRMNVLNRSVAGS